MPAPFRHLLLIVCGLLTGLTLSPVAAAILHSQGAVVLAFERSGDLYVTDLIGPPINLTNSSTYEMKPTWSPDGAELAFLSSAERHTWNESRLYILTLATGQIRSAGGLLLTSESNLAWSPNGRTIAVTDGDLFTINTETGAVLQLTDASLDPHSPSWSPDSQQIAFEVGGQIYRIDADGQNRMQLTARQTSNALPAFSPARSELLYIDLTDARFSLKRMTVSDGSVVPLLPREIKHDAQFPEWSPDGQRIAFMVQSGPQDAKATDIEVMDRDGSNVRKIVGNRRDSLIGWLPDGHRLLYWAGLSHQYDRWMAIADLDDGSRIRAGDDALNSDCLNDNCLGVTIRPVQTPFDWLA